MRLKNSKHEQAVDLLVDRLISSGKYKWVRKHVEYCMNGYSGEMDVLACPWDRDYKIYYEIKSSDLPKNYRKAIDQCRRANKAHLRWEIKGVYVVCCDYENARFRAKRCV